MTLIWSTCDADFVITRHGCWFKLFALVNLCVLNDMLNHTKLTLWNMLILAVMTGCIETTYI